MRYSNPVALIRRMTRAARRSILAEWRGDGFIEVMIFAIGGLAVSLLILEHSVAAHLTPILPP